MRSKRRCVLEKKQPYSGDEWCSGPDTEEEDDKPHTVTHRERVMSSGIRQGLSGSSSTTGPLPPEPSLTPGVGRGLGPGGHRSEVPRHSQQVVYVFTTSLANSAADAVIHGRTDSILLFHQQNVPRTKQLEQYAPSGKHPSLSELSSRATPPTGTLKSQSGTPRPASVGTGVGSHLQSVRSGTPSSTGPPETETPQTRPGGPGASNNSSSDPSLQPGGAIAPTPSGTGSGGGGEGDGTSPSGSPSVLSSHLQGDAGARGGSGPGANREDGGLSREQLEHRERSLQTLRDIERLLLRSGTAGGPGETTGPGDDDNNNNSNVNNNNNRVGGPAEDSDNAGNCENNGGGAPLLTPGGQVKRYEEPLQSMVSQTQQLGGPGLEDSPMRGAAHHHHHHHHHHLPPHHHHLHSPGGLDMGPLLGPDGLTPEQVAWRKLQEEYYQEKRRQQEIQPSPHTHPQHFRMMQEMGIGHGGPTIMMRGPPPPYHSKPGEQQWGPGAPMMGPGGMGPGNPRMIDMHQDGPRGPRFLGQMQRGPPGGGGFPGSPGGVLAMEGLGPQRGPRPGMWIEDLPPNMMGGGGGPFYHGGPGGGPQQHLQADPERLLTREEMFRIMEKRQLQGLHRLELERIAKQQQQGMGGPRMMEGPGGFPSQGMGRGPGSRGDPMDFPGSREMMGSPGGGGPQMRDLMDSPLGPGGMGMNMMNQQMMLQKMRGGGGGGPLGDMLSQEDIARIRAAQNGGSRGGGKVMNQGPDGPLQFPNQGPFPGGPGGGDGGYLQGHGADMFGGPDQHEGPHMGGTSRLSHMPMGGRPRGHPSDLSINVNPGMLSPAMPPPPHQLKSPPLTQEPSPLMSSPSAPGLKSPSQVSSGGGTQAQQHPLPPASGAGTPSSMKSPQVMGPSLGLRSPSGSPGRLKSPALVSSPGWTSPKTALPSPGGPGNGKGAGNGGSSSTETGPSLPPRSSNSTPISQPGSMAPSMPFTSSLDNPPTQNPLSLIMSQMSKYAMPSSTPLYHDAIKTIATSDDEMTPDRPLLSGVNIGGNLGNHQGSMLLSQSSMGPHSGPQSPLGMVLQGPSQLSPNPMGLPGMNPSMMGAGGGPPDGMGSSMSPMHPHNQMGGFPRMQNPSHGGPLHSPLGGLPPQFSQQNPDDVIPPLQHMLSKGLPHPQQHAPPSSDNFMGPEGPDLSDVIRPTHSGIPEFDLSRIIPSDKPSSTLQYFPKAEGQGGGPNPQQGRPGSQGPPPQLLKQLSAPSSNPHIANLQNMMAEQQLPPLPSHCGMGRPGMAGGPQGGSRGMGGGCMMPPGHLMGRTGMGSGPGGQQLHHHQHHHQQQQAMMANSLLHPGPHPSMMSPQHQQHHSMMAQQNLMLMQAKQRSMGLPGDPFGQQGGPLMSPGGPMMGPGPQHPQGGMMGPGAGPQGPLRQRGMSLDSPLGYGPGPGSMTNMPF